MPGRVPTGAQAAGDHPGSLCPGWLSGRPGWKAEKIMSKHSPPGWIGPEAPETQAQLSDWLAQRTAWYRQHPIEDDAFVKDVRAVTQSPHLRIEELRWMYVARVIYNVHVWLDDHAVCGVPVWSHEPPDLIRADEHLSALLQFLWAAEKPHVTTTEASPQKRRRALQFSVTQLAKYLGVSDKTARRKIKEGTLPSTPISGGCFEFDMEILEAYRSGLRPKP